MQFKTTKPDWFARHIPVWLEHLAPLLQGQPLNALEVGSYEGRSACWTLENILRHPTSTLTCIDPWDGLDPALGNDTIPAEARFDANTQQYSSKLIKLKGRSINRLAQLIQEEKLFDLVFIDGDHEGQSALTDLCMTWPLLKVGGYLLFDDYRWVSDRVRVLPRVAWDAFAAMQPAMKVIHTFRQQIAVRVK